MRKAIFALMLASTFAPTAAYPQDDDHDRGSRASGERSERPGSNENDGDARPQPSERATQRSERRERPDRVEGQADRAPHLNQSTDLDRAMRSDRMQGADRPARAERPAQTDRAVRDPQSVPQVEAPAPVAQSGDRPDSLIDGFRQVARDRAAGRDNDHDDDHYDRDWKKDWRKDKRYDWWHYRSRYSSLYRLGRYSDPYGWSYRRWPIGYGLWPSYYGSNYWLNDPWMYRLPPAYGPYRWVRYYDDALLVNIYTGHVVDVVYNFFW